MFSEHFETLIAKMQNFLLFNSLLFLSSSHIYSRTEQTSISQMSRRFRQAMGKDKQIEQTTEMLEKQINKFILNEI